MDCTGTTGTEPCLDFVLLSLFVGGFFRSNVTCACGVLRFVATREKETKARTIRRTRVCVVVVAGGRRGP